ncbi:MAG TPA: diaminopimelate epimerase [Burkholderiales bacterium]|nr:diaminopimelate epimerase [Burkholderiales bacterium]
MKLRFTKMHGLGNDFVVLDGVRQTIQLDADRLRAIADRHFGVGCDQILVVEPPRSASADFRYRIFNADGGEVEQCGNGARCFARFVRDKGLTDKRRIAVETLGGLIEPQIEADGRVTVDMGPPAFDPARVPFLADGEALTYDLEVEGETIPVAVLSMGNPHAVQRVADVNEAPVARLGPLVERHARFPQRVNAGFMEVVDRHKIKLRVYERGAGETLSCGTGACAAAVAGIRLDLLDSPVTVHTRGGDLTIAWAGVDNAAARPAHVYMTGPAETVYEGEIIVGD